ncbi:hypothetical protein F3Y22_tig00110271pilonHSYRG00015 [Hibiscus syriacus]|uniref:Uncharacterized protein n=1 Tax=Hibiscus syriacus TaxID=106335 RepID=A0A6A3B4V8_HIBSY|nr:hypothetical protein F3Y22_tig00110271pilonHSYRG00015 [Hibiscus syriacus]
MYRYERVSSTSASKADKVEVDLESGYSVPGTELRREPAPMGLYPEGVRHPCRTAGADHRGLCLRGVVDSGERAPPWKLWPLALPLFSPFDLMISMGKLRV